MEILLISYADIDFDGRLRSLISAFSMLGNVHCFTRGKRPINDISEVCNCKYSKFIGKAVQFSKSVEKVDWLVLDNRRATIPGMKIQKKCKPSVTIQDCRELYLMNESKGITKKIGCIFERKMIKRADIIICANSERAKIMQKEYNLADVPITYENLRQLEYESDEEYKKAKAKIDAMINDDEYRIISTSGCSILRTNDVLVKNLSKVDKKCRLYLVGDYTAAEKAVIDEIMAENSSTNVEIVGRLNQSELKYLISKCHIGIVNYGQYDTNNRLCASGKLYEFIYEGIPVVTTTNPPLKNICDEFKIGIADDAYYNGINMVLDQYESFCENVRQFSAGHTIIDNDRQLVKDISDYISRIK